nr:DUF4287 domain-containing protein [Pseudofrankia inefficax]
MRRRRLTPYERGSSLMATEQTVAKIHGPASYFPSIEKKYGRPIAEWKAIIRASGLTRHMELVGWLKKEYGLGHGHANALVADTLAART